MEISKEQLCRKIQEVYPDIGQCSIDVKVDFSEDKKTWLVTLEREGRVLSTHLEAPDAEACMAGKQCVSLGLQINQLAHRIEEAGFK